MANVAEQSRDKIWFEDPSEIEDSVELKLKRRLGRGLFVDKYDRLKDGSVTIHLGNVVPGDVSDNRDRDRVINFITYKPIYKLEAKQTDNGFIINLPNRGDIKDGLVDRRKQIGRRLDRTMAKAIYEELVTFTPVQNQLSGIKEILWVIREKQPVAERDIVDMRGRNSAQQTKLYLQVLKETEFIQQRENGYFPDTNLKAHDEKDVESEEFSKLVLGQIVERAYNTLKDELNLTLLAHYPKYAGSYYFSALQRDKPNLRLTPESVTNNLHMIYDDRSVHEYRVEKKLNDLANVGVVHRDDGMFKGNKQIFDQVKSEAPV